MFLEGYELLSGFPQREKCLKTAEVKCAPDSRFGPTWQVEELKFPPVCMPIGKVTNSATGYERLLAGPPACCEDEDCRGAESCVRGHIKLGFCAPRQCPKKMGGNLNGQLITGGSRRTGALAVFKCQPGYYYPSDERLGVVGSSVRAACLDSKPPAWYRVDGTAIRPCLEGKHLFTRLKLA